MNADYEDPIVAEVRAARQKLWEQAGGDLDKLVAMLQEMEKRETRPIVSFPPKRVPVAKPD
jgi:hypothetical protein